MCSYLFGNCSRIQWPISFKKSASSMGSMNGQLSERALSANDKLQFPLPHGAEELPFQIAGHRFGQSKNKLGILKHCQSGDILKPICDERSKREHSFYETIFSPQNDHDVCISVFRTLVPRYNGLFRDDHMNIDYIRLEDITAHLINVSLLDIKIGSITYDPEASEEKRRSQTNKYHYAKDLGFRILGMRFYDESSQQYHHKNREFGLQISPENVTSALLMFVQKDVHLLKQFVGHLEKIENWFKIYNVDRWKFISSSLLFAYGIPKNDCSDNNRLAAKKALVKMIDFAHVFPNVGTDENYLFGLLKLKSYLEKAQELCIH